MNKDPAFSSFKIKPQKTRLYTCIFFSHFVAKTYINEYSTSENVTLGSCIRSLIFCYNHTESKHGRKRNFRSYFKPRFHCFCNFSVELSNFSKLHSLPQLVKMHPRSFFVKIVNVRACKIIKTYILLLSNESKIIFTQIE